jgi:uncharacterized protein (DUF433 family)
MIAAPIDHIVIDDNGSARIKGSGIKVRFVAQWTQIGLTPEQMVEHYDLTLAQVYAALSYYYDHREKIDGQIAEAKALDAQYGPQAESNGQRLKEQAQAKGLTVPDEDR